MNQRGLIDITAETTLVQGEDYIGADRMNISVNTGTDEYIVDTCTFTNCLNGAIDIRLSNVGKASLSNSQFTGSERMAQSLEEILSQKIVISQTVKLIGVGQIGGGIYFSLSNGGNIQLDGCEFFNCTSNHGNGGGIYLYISFSLQVNFEIIDAYFHDCQSPADSWDDYHGYGAGIFLIGDGDYTPALHYIDFRGMKFYNNTAYRNGHTLYIITSKVIDLCRYGIQGEYIKGNYSDGISDQNELMGIPVTSNQFYLLNINQIQSLQKPLENWWYQPKGLIWHLLNRNEGTIQGIDYPTCAEFDHPCLTIEYTVRAISFMKSESDYEAFIDEKWLGICEAGFDLTSPYQFSKTGSHTNIIKIMKQLYGTDQEMSGQAEIKIIKGSDESTIENGHNGWISAIDGLELGIFGIRIISDKSKLTIPIIYIQEQSSILELNTITIFDIYLTPSASSKGIVHIEVDNSQFLASNCLFEKIDIEGSGGNVIRMISTYNKAITAMITSCKFIDITAYEDSESRGGAAICARLEQNSQLEINGETEFNSCQMKTEGFGGAFCAQMIYGGLMIIDGECSFIKCTTIIGALSYGGGLYADLQGENSQFQLNGDITFDSCESAGSGGGICFLSEGENIEIRINGSIQFVDCIGTHGGGMYIDQTYKIILVLSSSCTFLNCSGSYGGGMYIYSYNIDTDIQITGQLSFNNCSCKYSGGGLYLEIQRSSISFENIMQFKDCSSLGAAGGIIVLSFDSNIQITGLLSFDNCSTTNSGGGGYFSTNNKGRIVTHNITCNDCKAISSGGGIYIYLYDNANATIELNKMILIDCKSEYGGGLSIQSDFNSILTLSGQASFTGCESLEYGGGIFLNIFRDNVEIHLSALMDFVDCVGQMGGGMHINCLGYDSNIQIAGLLSFDNCSCQDLGGGLYIYSQRSSISFENIILFKDCSSLNSGGGIDASFHDGGIIEFIGELNFNNCSALYLGGGGLFSKNIKGQLEINNIICKDCKSQRAGGGIFIHGSNDSVIELSGIMTIIDCTGELGVGLYIEIYFSGQVIISNRCTFTRCITEYYGGGIYAHINQGSLTIERACEFFKCSSQYGGGALYLTIQDEASVIINNECIFDLCTSESSGGAIQAYINSGSILTIDGQCRFTECTTQVYGGGISADIEGENSKLIIGDGAIFDNCSSNAGGGIQADIRTGSQLIFEGDCQFINCSASNFIGGGMSAWCYDEGSLIRSLGELLFDNCSSLQSGGGAFLDIIDKASIEINKVTCIDCKSFQGAGLDIQSASNTYFAITGQASFTRCENAGFGGGIYIYIYGDNVEIRIAGSIDFIDCVGGYGSGMSMLSTSIYSNIQFTGQLSFINCSSNLGGGLYLDIINSSISFENLIQFKDCSSYYGGGISASCYGEGMIKFIGELNFNNCSSIDSGGGGDFYTNNNGHIVTNNITCNECKAYRGGGIFINSQGENSVIEFSGIMTFVDCLGNSGGGLYIQIQQSGQILISNRCTLTKCIAEYYGDTTFDRCICTQPGNGGGIALIQGISSIISITNSSFINCKTISNSSDQRYGWGGAIFIQTSVTAQNLNETNFIMRDLIFSDCSAVNSIGNNIHIQSSNTYNTGIAIALNSLLTVKDTPNLYTSQEYSNYYMGSDQSKVIDGNEPYSVHEPLFVAAQTGTEIIGGAIYLNIIKVGQVSISNTSFNQCEAYHGGGISVLIGTSGKLIIDGECNFTRCIAQQLGGGISADISGENSKFIIGDGVIFDACLGQNNGGGLYINIRTGSQLILEGNCKFIECSSVNGSGGGGIYAECYDEGSLIRSLGELSFDNCSSSNIGGGAFLGIGNEASIELNKVTCIDCKSDQGAGLTIELHSNTYFTITGQASFTRCESSFFGGGMYFNIQGDNAEIQLTGKMQFIDCIGGVYGGGIFIQSFYKINLVISNSCTFQNCSSGSYGGGIYLSLNDPAGSVSIGGECIFDRCTSETSGGALYTQINQGLLTIEGACQFSKCSSQYGGGAIYADVYNDGQILINGACVFSQCKSETSGGAFYISIYNEATVTIEGECIFTECESNWGGGGIYSNINNGTLNIENTTFDSCICTQPGNGGGIALIQGTKSIISITNSSFINCKTISNSSDQRYGWGGAIFIQTSVTAENLNQSNFIMRDLIFTGCSAINSIGNNIHIQSSNTYNAGIAIILNSLVTVKDTPNLYTSPEYSNDYMGIDQSKVIDGNEPYSDHEPLFVAAQTDSVTKQYYIRSFNSFDENDCSSTSPCKTINYILSQTLPEGFVKGLSVAIINQFSLHNNLNRTYFTSWPSF
ncbi:MAG: hypothetical protein EZS28_008815 [Streblomastix strix]|uniref:Uncharacterized protein n=1 Tax=Streblomastix strix TaxID=222440 RepID=A0A5J4WN49_9EUKA|nr:MAG: hypothetical protein EZS28_008815 [Streblomastix strix]